MRVISSVTKDLHAKTFIWPLMRRCLHVHVVKRWDVRVGIRAVDHFHRRHVFLSGHSSCVPCARGRFRSALARKDFRGAATRKWHGRQVPPRRQPIECALIQRGGPCQRIVITPGRTGSQFEVQRRISTSDTVQGPRGLWQSVRSQNARRAL